MSKFVFKNNSLSEHNDEIVPGAPYLLDNYSYKFLIQPKCNFWRFGIRFSKTTEIEFVKSGDRHLQNDPREFRDIQISVGNKTNFGWRDANVFQFAQYNFPKNQVQDHVFTKELQYVPQAPVEFKVSYNNELQLLVVQYYAEGCTSWGTSILLEGYPYFKIFAWADLTDFELECDLQIKSLDKTKSAEENLDPFTVGNITFRLGDMFNPYAQNACNVLLLPASTNGTATRNNLKRASEIGIPPPASKTPGKISLYKPKSKPKLLKAGYAYCVEDVNSDFDLVSKVCRNIIADISKLQASDRKIYTISLPLFGTGAGSLPSIEVALIYDDEFNKSVTGIYFLVSIINEKIYRSVKQRMLGKYIPLQNEALQKPETILKLESELNTIIDYSAYSLNDDSGEIDGLALSYITNQNLNFLEKFPQLQTLSLLGCKINNLSYLKQLPKLNSLVLISTFITDTNIFSEIKKLSLLKIKDSKISDISFLTPLLQLKSLDLAENNISQIYNISELKNLSFLDLSDNRISDITPLTSLVNLDFLLLAHNRISAINTLTGLQKLSHLDISHNRIYDIAPILNLPKLQFLKAEANPFINRVDLILNENENHLQSIKSLLMRQAENSVTEIALPVKVILLGNHASGKSSLLNYIVEDNLNGAAESTHIIKIQHYPKNSVSTSEAIFFDFGGQDYYHGIYRAFLTAGSIYLILWNEENNRNQKRLDSKGIFTQDFTLHYWLCQKKFYEQEKYDGEVDPVLLIQTHSDMDKRNSCADLNQIQDFENEFYISLATGTLPPVTGAQKVNELALMYFNASLLELINKKRNKNLEPQWYIQFLNYVVTQNAQSTHESKSVLNDILPNYNREILDNKLEFLKNDLDQLHKRGLILYYKAEEEINDCVWLNPVALVTYIYNTILTADRNENYKGRIPIDKFSDVQPQILQLLRLQKVIFKHEYGDNSQAEYITPNFLPLAEEDSDFDIFTFGIGAPTINLKFKHFLPFGLINQLICHFGDLTERKKFWRDRLLFTFNNSRVLIHIDFQLLQIEVSCSFSKEHKESDIQDIKGYLFYSIMALYWDFKEVLAFDLFRQYFKNGLNIDDISPENVLYYSYFNCKNFYENKECRPIDLYISVDNINYISYRDLCSEKSAVMINTKFLNPEKELIDSPKVIPIYPFQPFTKRQLKRPKKVAISYSTKDLDLVHKFRDYLVSLHDDGLIENPFQCTQLIAGQEWDEEIQRKFAEADIIFFMVSENLMANKYVKEFEIKNAIDRREADKSFQIIPIILVYCQWQRAGKYNLGQYTALPFKAQPITAFKDQHEAWFCTIELIKIMIEKDLNSDNAEIVLTPEVKRIQEEYFIKK